MAKNILFDIEARVKLLDGVGKVERAVGSTLGPRGANVAIEREWGHPIVLQDGVSVAKEIVLKDRYENMGAQLVRQAAEKTNDEAGDGTTTATILTHAMAVEAHKNVVAGSNPMILRRGMEKAVSAAVTALEKIAVPVKTAEEAKQVAVISAQNAEIGALVAEAIERIGNDGVVAVEEGKSTEMSIEYKNGLGIDAGYVAHYFMTNPESREAAMENCAVLVTDLRISDLQEMIKFANVFFTPEVGRPLFLICGSIEGSVLATLVANQIKGQIRVLPVIAPGFGEHRKALLQDIAIVTGARFVSEDAGASLGSVGLSDLGNAVRVTARKDSTTIVGDNKTKKSVDERIAELKAAIEKSTVEIERERLQERLARLSSGIAIINVGAESEAEMREKKERVIDAVNATKAAKDLGIVPGGEIALLHAKNVILAELEDVTDVEERIGISIIMRALEAPFRRLMRNAGLDEGRMLAKMDESKKNMGVDVMDGKVKDLVKAGIIDPVKVTINALKNASSVAAMIITTGTLIVEEPKEDVQE